MRVRVCWNRWQRNIIQKSAINESGLYWAQAWVPLVLERIDTGPTKHNEALHSDFFKARFGGVPRVAISTAIWAAKLILEYLLLLVPDFIEVTSSSIQAIRKDTTDADIVRTTVRVKVEMLNDFFSHSMFWFGAYCIIRHLILQPQGDILVVSKSILISCTVSMVPSNEAIYQRSYVKGGFDLSNRQWDHEIMLLTSMRRIWCKRVPIVHPVIWFSCHGFGNALYSNLFLRLAQTCAFKS